MNVVILRHIYCQVKIFDGLEHTLRIQNAHITIGTFDGVHIGHQKIIKQLIHKAKVVNGESVLFTFYPHPRTVLNPGERVSLIQTIEEKLDKLKRLGLQNVIVYPFTKEFSQTPAEQFIQQFLVEKLKVCSVVIGYDHQFGRNREGSLEHFQKLGSVFNFEVEEIPAQDIDDINVSSTKIRNALNAGKIETANEYLGEPFLITGRVVKGKALGRTIGYPTANLFNSNTNKIIPKNGVYLIRCQIHEKTHFGMMNIGHRPTIEGNNLNDLSLEVHIFDFQNDIYGSELQVELLSFIRDEIQFSGTESLRTQLAADENHCRMLAADFSLEAFTL